MEALCLIPLPSKLPVLAFALPALATQYVAVASGLLTRSSTGTATLRSKSGPSMLDWTSFWRSVSPTNSISWIRGSSVGNCLFRRFPNQSTFEKKKYRTFKNKQHNAYYRISSSVRKKRTLKRSTRQQNTSKVADSTIISRRRLPEELSWRRRKAPNQDDAD